MSADADSSRTSPSLFLVDVVDVHGAYGAYGAFLARFVPLILYPLS